MHGWQRLLTGAPLPVLFVVQAVLFGAGTHTLGRLTGQPGQSWIASLIGAVTFGVLMTAWIARERRRSGGADAFAHLERAVSTGQLPPGADAEEWRPRLERQERSYRRLRVLAPVVFVLFAAASVWLAVSQTPLYWIFVAVFLGLGVHSLVTSARRLRRIETMLDRLGTTAPRR